MFRHLCCPLPELGAAAHHRKGSHELVTPHPRLREFKQAIRFVKLSVAAAIGETSLSILRLQLESIGL